MPAQTLAFLPSVSLCKIPSLSDSLNRNTPIFKFFFISDSFFAIINAYNGDVPSDNSAISGSLTFQSSTVSSLPSLNMTLGSEIFSIPPLKYIVPRSLYPILNVTDVPGIERTWIESAGPGEFSLGQKWLENFYTAYDSK